MSGHKQSDLGEDIEHKTIEQWRETLTEVDTGGDVKRRAIAVVGAGLIGRGWAIVFARSRCQVRLYDTSSEQLQNARLQIEAQLALMTDAGMIADSRGILDCIEYVDDLATAVEGVEYVQECGPEILETKQELFAELDRLTHPDACLASSTSAIRTSLFTGNLTGRHRMLVAHPVNPPHLVPLVELSPAPWTDAATVDRARQLMSAVGQSPILVKQEIDGFILNRLQAALLNEAVRLVADGYVSPADLDKTVADGLGLRWSFMGPFETIDLNAPAGVRDYAERYSPFFRRIVESQSTVPDWQGEALDELDAYNRERLSIDEIATRSQWRDERLAQLRVHKSNMQERDG